MNRAGTARRWLPAALAVLAMALPAHAQTATRRIGVIWHADAPDVSFSAADLVTDHVRDRLASGLLQTLRMTTHARVAGTTTPIAIAVRQCQVVYDIWADRYSVDVHTESSDRSITLDSIDRVIETCLVADHVVIGGAAAWRDRPGNHVVFGVTVELNPVTADTVERIRRWLRRPEGGAAPDSAFFGSFVSYFVTRQINEAERTITFDSQELTCP